jgi:dimethylglycine dehydrogenase
VRLELAAIGTELEIEILGEKYKAIVIEESPFDPTNECLRS